MSFSPFSTVAEPFSIGLKPVDSEQFVYIDEDWPRYRAEKLALYESQFDRVFMANNDTVNAQQEAANLVARALKHEPSEHGKDLPPLANIALEVQDDLVLMRRRKDGWCLVAASLCFPSSWTLFEKFDRPMESIHSPVPMSDKMHARINRIFDNLQPKVPVWRENWSLDNDAELRHEKSENRKKNKNLKTPDYFFLRTEYQTLHKLPESGDILFTIGVRTRHLSDIAKQPNGQQMLGRLIRQLEAMTNDQLAYKGIHGGAANLMEWLSEQARLSQNA